MTNASFKLALAIIRCFFFNYLSCKISFYKIRIRQILAPSLNQWSYVALMTFSATPTYILDTSAITTP